MRSSHHLWFLASILGASACALATRGDPEAGPASTSTGTGGAGGHDPAAGGGGQAVVPPVCGDGVVAGGEECDDGNSIGGDGCSPECTIDHGFSCSGAPSACDSTCGDGIVALGEDCDDDDTLPLDGCDSDCRLEPGFSCAGEPSACAAVCGDGMRAPHESCDDGNVALGDGCDDHCQIEIGFSCTGLLGQPSACAAICGDGAVLGAEQCEDGNITAGDGCGADCRFEATCGNGVVEPGESCDGGPPCDGTCHLMPGNICGDAIDLRADGVSTVTGNVTVYNGTTTGSMLVNFAVPECGTNSTNPPAVNVPTVVHRYRIGPKPASLRVETVDIDGNLDDTIVWAYKDCLDRAMAFACDDDAGPDKYSDMKTATLPAGTVVFLLLSGYYTADVGNYRLRITETSP